LTLLVRGKVKLAKGFQISKKIGGKGLEKGRRALS